jgi:uncharacterized membrane protein YfhO
VLSDLYYVGWRALVDGENEKVYKADYAFRAVPVEKGSHFVELIYDPWSFKLGLGTSACALAVLVGSSAWLLASRARAPALPATDPPKGRA